MSEIKRPRISQIDAFMEDWMHFLRDLLEVGGDVLPTERTRHFFWTRARFYTMQVIPGVVLWVPGVACHMAGADSSAMGPPFDTKYGRVAHGWGTWVEKSHRRQGWARKMRAISYDRLREQGFDTVVGGAHVENEGSLASGRAEGLIPLQQTFYKDLRRPE